MWCLRSKESCEILAADNDGRQSGCKEATSIWVKIRKKQVDEESVKVFFFFADL